MPADTELLKEIRDEVRAVRDGQNAAFVQLASLNEWRNGVTAQEYDKRLRSLENGKAWLLGYAAAVALVASILVKVIWR